MATMYKRAYGRDDVVVYCDSSDNRFVARGGGVAWRTNNPGLVHHHCHFAKKNESIGACGNYAIFSHPLQGQRALSDWLHSKKYYESDFETLAVHYSNGRSPDYARQLALETGIFPTTKICDLSEAEFERLLQGIAKLCGYGLSGDEELSLLPKVTFSKISFEKIAITLAPNIDFILLACFIITPFESVSAGVSPNEPASARF